MLDFSEPTVYIPLIALAAVCIWIALCQIFKALPPIQSQKYDVELLFSGQQYPSSTGVPSAAKPDDAGEFGHIDKHTPISVPGPEKPPMSVSAVPHDIFIAPVTGALAEREKHGIVSEIKVVDLIDHIEFQCGSVDYNIKLGQKILYGKLSKRQVQARLKKVVTNYGDIKQSLVFLKTRIVLKPGVEEVLLKTQ